MTKSHLVDVLIKLKNAFPLFYANRPFSDLSSVAEVWYEHLGHHADEVIDRAVFLMIERESEVPTIALVNKYIPKAKEAIKYDKYLADEKLQENIRRLSR